MMASRAWRAFLRTPTFWSVVLLLTMGTIRLSTGSGLWMELARGERVRGEGGRGEREVENGN